MRGAIASARGLAADIERYLRNEPVDRASAQHRCIAPAKYIRRHRLGVAVAATGMLLLAGFAIVQSVEVRHIAASVIALSESATAPTA